MGSCGVRILICCPVYLFLQLPFRSSAVKRTQHNDRSISIIKQFQFLAYFPSFPLSRFLFPDRNEPGRFFGDGVSFKAKLIGILEVGEARGDRMCQEALQVLERPTKGWRGFCLSFYVYFMLKGHPPHTAQDVCACVCVCFLCTPCNVLISPPAIRFDCRREDVR